MDKKTILKDNKLIAGFMGLIPHSQFPHVYEGSKDNTYVDPKYNSNWNDLMPVVDKIETIGYDIHIENGRCDIYESETGYILVDNNEEAIYSIGENRINGVYYVCVNFIKWYNENKGSNEQNK